MILSLPHTSSQKHNSRRIFAHIGKIFAPKPSPRAALSAFTHAIVKWLDDLPVFPEGGYNLL